MATSIYVTQALVETVSPLPGIPIRATQTLVETASNGDVALRVTQVLAEVISRVAPPVIPTTPVFRYIRRMRQSPHLSDEQVNLFFAQFQIDFEAGSPREGID